MRYLNTALLIIITSVLIFLGFNYVIASNHDKGTIGEYPGTGVPPGHQVPAAKELVGYLYTPPVSVGTKHYVLCNVVNASMFSLKIIGVQIIDQNGNVFNESCNKTLGPGEICTTDEGRPDNSTQLYCKIAVEGGPNKQYFRGALQGYYYNINFGPAGENTEWYFLGRSEFVAEAR